MNSMSNSETEPTQDEKSLTTKNTIIVRVRSGKTFKHPNCVFDPNHKYSYTYLVIRERDSSEIYFYNLTEVVRFSNKIEIEEK